MRHIASHPEPLYASLYDTTYTEADMQQPKLDQDILPLSEFRSGVASFVKRVNETKRPLVLTQHGRGVAVLADIQEFETMRERLALFEDIAVSAAQIDAGQVLDHEEAMKRVLDKIGA